VDLFQKIQVWPKDLPVGLRQAEPAVNPVATGGRFQRPDDFRLRPPARVEQVASVSQVTELTLTGRS
jgi:hypothetical protein